MPRKSIGFCLFLVFLLLLLSGPAAGMQPLAEQEMDAVTAGGFSSFAWMGDTARAEFDIQVRTYAEIDSFRAHNQYYGLRPGKGSWDQSWNGVSLGNEQTDLELRDFVFEARFANPGDAENRQLLGLKVGFENVTGRISGEFARLSREGGEWRDTPGQQIYEFNGDKLILHIDTEQGGTSVNPGGVWVDFGNAQAVP